MANKRKEGSDRGLLIVARTISVRDRDKVSRLGVGTVDGQACIAESPLPRVTPLILNYMVNNPFLYPK